MIKRVAKKENTTLTIIRVDVQESVGKQER